MLPDYPITKKDQDQLRRFPLAEKIAELISSFEYDDSLVIGIEGRWGSGKTSFTNLILSQLSHENVEHFVFNPWNFSDEESLLRDFFFT